MCEIMSINRSGYYKWKNRKGTLNRYEQNRIDLTKLLEEQHKKHSVYGYHNLAKIIREETGWVFSDNLAHKCCKEAGIRSTARRTYHPNKGKENIKFPNKICGNWNAKRPMEIVVSDMTVLRTKKQGKVEWTYMLDTYNNEIIASSLSKREGDTRPYYKCLETLVQKAKKQTAPGFLPTARGPVSAPGAESFPHIGPPAT